jgi:hypothetical protein
MSEGKLYQKLRFPHADADDFDSYPKASEIEKLLDEAKADFPERDNVSPIAKSTDELFEREFLKAHDKWTSEVWAWLKKWFGV